MKVHIPILLLFFSHIVFAQSRPGSPGYSPLPAKIVVDDFKSSSKLKNKEKLTISELNDTTPSELLHIYTNYEVDSAGVFDSHGEFVPIHSKFMDLYLVYEYKYRLNTKEVEIINNLLPNILSKNGDQLLKISLISYTTNKEKVKTRKIKKKYFHYSIKNDQILINIDKSQLISQYLDIEILIKSRNYMSLTPVFSNGEYFSRKLICSIPSFLYYSFPESNEVYNLDTSSESSFKVLELNRGSTDWDEITKEYKVSVNNFSWTLPNKGNSVYDIQFIGFDQSFNIDMGFKMSDILK